MIDNNERMTYLDMRHRNNERKRIINAVLNNYIRTRMYNNSQDANKILQERTKEATRNLLFLKFCGIEYEGIYQSFFNDRKLTK